MSHDMSQKLVSKPWEKIEQILGKNWEIGWGNIEQILGVRLNKLGENFLKTFNRYILGTFLQQIYTVYSGLSLAKSVTLILKEV